MFYNMFTQKMAGGRGVKAESGMVTAGAQFIHFITFRAVKRLRGRKRS